MAKQAPNSTPVKGTTLTPPGKPKAARKPSQGDQIAALAEQVAALTALVAGNVDASAAPKEQRQGKGSRKAKAEDSQWSKGTTFTYVKKNGAESTFRVTEVSGKRAKVRNQGSGFTSNFKLTTLDALLQAGNVKDVR